MSERNRTFILYGVLLFVPFLVFFPTLEAGFLNWDDDVNVFKNPNVHGLTAANLEWMFTDFKHAIRYKPLSWLGWAFIYEFFGLNPFGYHLANVLVHCANCLLLYLVFHRLIRIAVKDTGEREDYRWFAAGGALLWAVHPMRVEPVSWVTGLPYGVAFLLALVSTALYLHAATTEDSRPRRVYFCGAVVAFALAAITYPIVLGYPAVFVAIEFFPLRKFTKDGKLALWTAESKVAFARILPFAMISIALIGWTVYGRYRFTEYWIRPASMEDFGICARIMQASYVWAYYAWKPLWPTDLAPVYTELIWNHPSDTAFVLALAMVLVLSVLLIWRWRKNPCALAIWIAHLGILFPMLGLTERPHYAHDRYGIVNGALLSIALVTVVVGLCRKSQIRKFIYATGTILLLVSAMASHHQTRHWHNNIAFFTHMSARLGANEYRNLALMNLGEAFMAKEEYEKAIPCFEGAANREVLWVFPFDFQRLAVNHGAALLSLSRWGDAEEQFRKAISLNPGNVAARNNLAIALLRQNRQPEAAAELQAALQHDPNRADTLFNLATILIDANQAATALPLLTKALTNASEVAPIHAKLADAYRQLGDESRAAQHAAMAREP